MHPRPICTVPLLCVLACTASHPDADHRPHERVLADDLDAAPIPRPPPAPQPGASTPGEATTPVASDVSTPQAERGGYSGSRGFENFGGRGTRVPTVRLAPSEVVGALDRDLVRRSVRAHLGEVQRCFDEVLSRDPNAKGRVAVAFSIDGNGKVAAATVQESTMKDPAAAACIAAAVVGWRFAKPRTGTVKVVIPFILEPG